ncbi:VOC family protein [Pararhodonellum marinum]|uniref:VOC family protein n=1 Tax=Pararhodonellum marinum TaxID=2755358 RepID=UPI00188F534F|nr:VOC family protein [Pararhodonellum marinum]
MKTPLLLILILLFSMNAYSQTQINHIAVYVEDLKKSADFYRSVLGLEEIEEPFKDNLHAWFSIGTGASLHLIEDDKNPWVQPTINKINHLCFSMKDLDGFIEKLGKANIPFEDWPGEVGSINVRPDGIRQIYVRDPDGYWLEINDDFH